MNLAPDAGGFQSAGVGEILVVEQIEGPHAQPGRRQAGEVIAAGGDRAGRVGATEVGGPADPVAGGVPQPEPGVIQCRVDSAVVEHGVGQDLKDRPDLGAVAGQECQRRSQAAARAGTADRDAARVDAGQLRQPPQRPVAVLQRGGVRMLGGQAVIHRRHHDAELAGQGPAEVVVLGGVADHVTAAVDPQQGRRRSRGAGRSVQSDADTARQCQHFSAGAVGFSKVLELAQYRQGPAIHDLSGNEPCHPAQLGVDVRVRHIGHYAARPAAARPLVTIAE